MMRRNRYYIPVLLTAAAFVSTCVHRQRSESSTPVASVDIRDSTQSTINLHATRRVLSLREAIAVWTPKPAHITPAAAKKNEDYKQFGPDQISIVPDEPSYPMGEKIGYPKMGLLISAADLTEVKNFFASLPVKEGTTCFAQARERSFPRQKSGAPTFYDAKEDIITFERMAVYPKQMIMDSIGTQVVSVDQSCDPSESERFFTNAAMVLQTQFKLHQEKKLEYSTLSLTIFAAPADVELNDAGLRNRSSITLECERLQNPNVIRCSRPVTGPIVHYRPPLQS